LFSTDRRPINARIIGPTAISRVAVSDS
jgi:hypothetical protein